LRLEPTEGAPTVIGDRTLLRQAVSNLIDNAVKYTRPRAGQCRLDIIGQEAVIHITDTGIGIASEDQVRLFEKFYRIKRRETATSRAPFGAGAGQIHCGTTQRPGVGESELDKGSTFYIALPLPTEEQAQQVVCADAGNLAFAGFRQTGEDDERGFPRFIPVATPAAVFHEQRDKRQTHDAHEKQPGARSPRMRRTSPQAVARESGLSRSTTAATRDPAWSCRYPARAVRRRCIPDHPRSLDQRAHF
jgi:hypothetical protein